MARDYLSIGSSPCEEDCIQVGSEGYYEKAPAECKRFIDAIRVKCGPEPWGAALKVKSFPHDFGTYHEVVCYFNEGEVSEEYAFHVEGNCPVTWDDVEPDLFVSSNSLEVKDEQIDSTNCV